jgi:DNA-binding response OmpR family regulator
MKLLLVDDDYDLVELLTFALGRAGFDVLQAADSPTALALLRAEQPDLAVLDINLGAWNGFDLLKELRQRSGIPVIMLTGRDAEDDKVRGLELGADDYLTKPFGHRELLARIRAQLRRRGREAPAAAPAALAETTLEVGPLVLNVAEHACTKDGRPLNLSVTEFRLLQYLMQHAGAVVDTRTLMRQVWGFDDPSGKDMVRVTVHRLRRKLEADPAHPRLLHTVPGVGVMLKPAPAEAPEG